MYKKQKQSSLDWGFTGLITGILALISLVIVPLVALPLIITTIVLSVVGILKGSKVYSMIGLGIGILGLIGLVIIGFVGVDVDNYYEESVNLNPDFSSVTCEDLSEEQCLNYSGYCQLCTENVVSSYVGCHAIEFCNNVPPMFDPESTAISYVKDMPEFLDYNGRDLNVTKLLEARCIGCYTVELEFLMDSMKNSSVIDKASIAIVFNDWVIVDVVSTFGSISEPNQQNTTANVIEKVIPLPENVISVEDCKIAGGEVFNTLGETSYEGEMIGRMDELLCPCACLIK